MKRNLVKAVQGYASAIHTGRWSGRSLRNQPKGSPSRKWRAQLVKAHRRRVPPGILKMQSRAIKGAMRNG